MRVLLMADIIFNHSAVLGVYHIVVASILWLY